MASIINATTTAGVSVQGDNSGSLQLATNNGTTAVTIDTSQNVGIGTSSPAARLDVRTTSSTQATFTRTGQTAVCTLYQSSADTYLSATNSGANLILATQDTERMRITSTGDVGIGTSSPSTKLHVAGGDLRLNDNFAIGWGGTGAAIIGANNSLLRFDVNGSERMRINSSGQLLIGSTSLGSANLNSVGSSAVRPQINIYNTDTGSTAQGLMEFFRNAVFTGGINNTGTTTAYTTSSDYRLKENIAPMTGALAKVSQLKPCTYTWKATGETSQGFIAHELQEIVPDCVSGAKDAMRTEKYEITPAIPATFDEEGNELTPAVEAVMGEHEVPAYQGVDTSFLVATLTAAIQELKAELDATKAEVQALKGVA